MEIRAFQSAVRTKDTAILAAGWREFRATDMTEDQIFRLAVGGEPGLTRDVWADLVELALERHPWGTPKERFPLGARVEMHPSTDEWMMGDRYGKVTGHKEDLVRVKLDKSGKSRLFEARQLRDDRLGKL
jgi:hypothetical protein